MIARLLPALVTVGIAVGLLILAWPQLFSLAREPVAAQIVSLRGLGIPIALVLALGFTVLALLARPARAFLAGLAVALLAFAAINAAVLATRGFGNLAFETPTDSSVTVLEWNTLGEAPGAHVIAQLALDTGADIVALPETTRSAGAEIAVIMAEAGRPMQVLTVSYDEISKARSTTVLISVELGDYGTDETGITTAQLPSVVATPTDGSGPTIVAVHTVAPLPPVMPMWTSDLRWAAAICSGDDVIMAGDFNATLDHFGGLSTASGATLGNCVDAAFTSDNAAVGTWPTAIPPLLGAPIDHVMATPNWRVSGMRVIESHDGFGSDHRPILVQLARVG
ncbi:MAG: endonuclease/exonuclease/phosphatase family protein [Rhodoglobus sp.]|nr:endonuclease/exonuclease/phosphatase family protein [Rhodoglobus sp.]